MTCATNVRKFLWIAPHGSTRLSGLYTIHANGFRDYGVSIVTGKVYALLVGINDYSPEVGKLTGCINDVDHFHRYLKDSFDESRLRIEVLKDADATRPNIIEQFRTHLCRATAEDMVVFQYCGHGARCK